MRENTSGRLIGHRYSREQSITIIRNRQLVSIMTNVMQSKSLPLSSNLISRMTVDISSQVGPNRFNLRHMSVTAIEYRMKRYFWKHSKFSNILKSQLKIHVILAFSRSHVRAHTNFCLGQEKSLKLESVARFFRKMKVWILHAHGSRKRLICCIRSICILL